MTLRPFVRLAILTAGLVLLAGPVALAQKKSDSAVKAKATAGKIDKDGKQVVTITLEIDPKYHIYANPVGLADFADTQTTVTISGKVKPESVKVDYPAGETKKDKTVGDYKIYKGKVTIKATVQRAKGDTAALSAAIKVQACTDMSCLLPATIKLAVE
jgi:DsbC/DsbD-like thiol-disulfide interchange protein